MPRPTAEAALSLANMADPGPADGTPAEPSSKERRLAWAVYPAAAIVAIIGVALIVVAVAGAKGWAPAAPFVTATSAGNAATFTVAGATLLLADFTALLAWFTWESIRATRREAKIAEDALTAANRQADVAEKGLQAAQDQAKIAEQQVAATNKQAEIAERSIRELIRTRELDWRPVLIRSDVGALSSAQGIAFRQVTIHNAGRGPAMNLFYVREDKTANSAVYLVAGAFTLAPGEGGEVSAFERREPPHSTLFQLQDKHPKELILCEDHFGNNLAYTPGFPVPQIWSAQEEELFGEDGSPSWFPAFDALRRSSRGLATPAPAPGRTLMEQVRVGISYANNSATFVLEAVPPDYTTFPSTNFDDAAAKWMSALRPDATRRSTRPGNWVVGQTGDTWQGWLHSGPTLTVRQNAAFKDLSGSDQYQPKVAALMLQPLVAWWQDLTRSGLSVLAGEAFSEARLGLALSTYGTVSMIRIADIDFGDLPRPNRWVTPDNIPSWQYVSELAFSSSVFPRADLEAATRSLLDNFGYREVDEVLAALGLRHDEDATEAPGPAPGG